MPDIYFMQYNIGSGLADLLLKYSAEELQVMDVNEEAYQASAEARNRGLLAIADLLDVLFLQEVLMEPKNKELIEDLKEKGFSIIHRQKTQRPDCVIAIKNSQFTFSEEDNRSFYDPSTGYEFSIIRAKHNASHSSMIFASAHMTGFLNHITEENASDGNIQCQTLVDILAAESDVTIIGCDLNSQRYNTETGQEVYPARNDIFTQAGYAEYTTEEPTAEFIQSWLPLRHLDYFYVKNLSKSRVLDRIMKLFTSTTRADFSVVSPREFQAKLGGRSWDWFSRENNSSDHMPIVGRLTI